MCLPCYSLTCVNTSPSPNWPSQNVCTCQWHSLYFTYSDIQKTGTVSGIMKLFTRLGKLPMVPELCELVDKIKPICRAAQMNQLEFSYN